MYRSYQSMLSTAALSIAVCLGSGCALVRGTTQKVSISTSEPDARVIINGQTVGYTREQGVPLVLTRPRNVNCVVTASKDGYKSETVMIDSKISGIGIVDAIGAYLVLIPGISILTGSAMTLTPSDVHVTLHPIKAPVVAAAPPESVLPATSPSPGSETTGAPPVQAQSP